MRYPSLLLLFLFILYSCAEKKQAPLFELVQNSGIDFNNRVEDGQIENSFYFRNFYNGGGVATGDIDNDGLADILFTSNMGENKLYRNKGDFKFEDISRSAGLRQDSMWSTGVVMADVNADGWLDIYECNSGHMKSGNRRNKLYINNRNKTFTEQASAYGLDISGYCTQASFFDYDLDGDLDCFLINNSPMPINNLGYTNRRDLPDAQWPVAGFLKGGGDHLYRNDNGKFIEVSKEAGIHGTLMSFGLGLTVGDVNGDNYPDIFVANDSYERDYLYINQGNGTFRDDLENCMEHNSFSSMGTDLADVNNDGYPDIFTTDMLPSDDYRLKTLGAFDNIDLYRTRLDIGFYHQFMKNCLMINNKNGQFLETANFSGVSASDWTWGALFFDADNDGNNDIYVCNGVNRDVTNLDFMDFFANDVVQKMVISGQKENVDSVLQHIPVHRLPNHVFRNLGNLRFEETGMSWGFGTPSFSNGAAYADLDNDGDLDLVVNNINQPAFLYRNHAREQNGNNFIGLQLKGGDKNPFAVGAKIKVFKGAEIYYRELVPSRGFQSSVDYRQVIGIGKHESLDSVLITWPNGTMTRIIKPAINKWLKAEQAISTIERSGIHPSFLARVSTPLLQSQPFRFEKHTEDDYIDFYYERNLPEMLSREGPHIAKADVNGDGLEDIFIGGARNSAGQLYIQTRDSFIKKDQDVFAAYADFEDVAVLFFDADRDGDADLFIGSGGNRSRGGSRELQHRLFKNDGKGNFSIDTKAFPINDMNISVAAAHDFDGDGDEDLFVGSRSVPFLYAAIPVSYLYRNDGNGQFSDVTPPEISKAGRITSAAWADINSDGKKELLVTGTWMPTRIYSWSGNRFSELKNTGLNELYGWWQTLHVTDLNEDGKPDLVIGNIGENFYLRPDTDHPVKLWVGDYDHSGTPDGFLTRSVDGRDVPVFLKREITDQFPGLKKNNLKHSDYARKSVQELFPAEVIQKTFTLQFNYCSSVIAFNNGKGTFTVHPLPTMVQLSSVNAAESTDVNGDGKKDLILAGNMFGFPPQFGRLDASYGHLLLNKGGGEFRYIETRESGLNLRGETRDMKEIKTAKGSCILIVQNDKQPVLYKPRK